MNATVVKLRSSCQTGQASESYSVRRAEAGSIRTDRQRAGATAIEAMMSIPTSIQASIMLKIRVLARCRSRAVERRLS